MSIIDAEALEERARNLGTLNGVRLLLVSLQPGQARLELRCHNANHLAAIALAAAAPAQARAIFPISGGRRVRAGPATGQVQVIGVAQMAPDTLDLTVAPIGDYSTYTLSVRHPGFDTLPALCEMPFKFRPACFSAECAPCAPRGRPTAQRPAIDYLARDFDSLRHVLVGAMMQRVPGWTPSSEADLDQVLLELLAGAGDELADYQDRVMNEAYFGSARKRVSIARHARLVDYHIHQGHQASTWLALDVTPGTAGTFPAGFTAWGGALLATDPGARVFVTRDAIEVDAQLNQLIPHTWSGAVSGLEAGATTADLALDDPTQAAADRIRDLICAGDVPQLVIEEALDPSTGRIAGRDLGKRQLLRLRDCGAGSALPGAESVYDPIAARWVLRVRWIDEDRLRARYCATVDCPPPVGRVDGVTVFRGNLVLASHGAPRTISFHEPGTLLVSDDDFHYERDARDALAGGQADGRCCDAHGVPGYPGRGAICRLPDAGLMYVRTPPGGEVPPWSTLQVSTQTDAWEEHIDLLQSGDARHFVVETDELGMSLVRFGHDGLGAPLPPDAVVTCHYQAGDPLAGNIGCDTLERFDRNHLAFAAPAAAVAALQLLMASGAVHHPFDVTDGRAPEPVAQVLRRAPEAYSARQLRAVTLEDYVKRAEEVEGVSRAAAAYLWTGSWRTVRVTIDPLGTAELSPALVQRVSRHLESVRLIGEDLEIRPPRFVPLDVRLAVCAAREYWPEDVHFALREEFSDGWTSDGRRAFFHPDRFTFGQPLHASEIIGRAQAVAGVEHVIALTMKRWNDPAAPTTAIVDLRPSEIVLVANDPDDTERGFMTIDVRGGRR